MPVRFAICNEVFGGWDFARVGATAKALGYDGLELAPFTLAPAITELTPARRRELVNQAATAGVDIVGLHWLLAHTTGFHLTSPDAGVQTRTADYLIALTRACRDLGGDVMVFGSPAQRSRLPGVSAAHALDAAAATLERVLPALDDCRVNLCLEPLTRDETDFMNTCADALALITRLGHPRVVLHLDVKAMSAESAPVPDTIRRHAGHAGHFHANDPNRKGPGMGAVDFVPIFAALRQSGYKGWVSVEPFDYAPDPETVARKSIDYMRRCIGDLVI